MKISRRQLIQAGAVATTALIVPQVAKSTQPTGLVHVDKSLERFTTGFSQIDQALGGGLRRGGLYLFIGAPNTGKTSLTKYIGHKNNIKPRKWSDDICVHEIDQFHEDWGFKTPLTNKLRLQALRGMKKVALNFNLAVIATVNCNREPAVVFNGNAHERLPHSLFYVADAVFQTSKDHGEISLKLTKNRYGDRLLDGPKFSFTNSGLNSGLKHITGVENTGPAMRYINCTFPV